jgi:hypothetical protein
MKRDEFKGKEMGQTFMLLLLLLLLNHSLVTNLNRFRALSKDL